ncbi:MAG TPA: wax ester/triacylglycerol synthase family O-acyltransferase, partial [Aggregatilineales bacterium]|nr:wax ester/triacylglycerol synthase family O-acyltransferase [Aggregatilineales bacterium]
MALKNERILGPVDGAFYYVESQKTPMNIGAVCIFDGTMPFDELVKFVDSRIHRAPIYQQKIVQAPLNLGQPTWMYDPDFYVGNHIFRLRLESPGNDEQLRQLSGRLVSSPLNRDKPLWEMHVIEGLSDNRTAIFFKVH